MVCQALELNGFVIRFRPPPGGSCTGSHREHREQSATTGLVAVPGMGFDREHWEQKALSLFPFVPGVFPVCDPAEMPEKARACLGWRFVPGVTQGFLLGVFWKSMAIPPWRPARRRG